MAVELGSPAPDLAPMAERLNVSLDAIEAALACASGELAEPVRALNAAAKEARDG